MVSPSKRRHRQRRPGRRTDTRQVRKRILVLCEGEVTEPEYLHQFKAYKRNPLVDVEIPKDHGVPRTLVEAAKERKQRAEQRAHRRRDDNLRYDEVWCVFDVDEHPKVDEARQMAGDNEILLAISNPCFELWLLLHFRQSPGPQHRRTLRTMLKSHVPDYDKHVDFDLLRDGYEQAKKRAMQLLKQAREDGETHRNPTTGVHLLTASIAHEEDE